MAAFFVLLTELVGEDSSNDSLYLISNRRRQLMAQSISTVVAASQIRHIKPRIENYVECVMPMYNIDDFKQRFRMSRTSFEQLLAELTPVLSTRTKTQIRP